MQRPSATRPIRKGKRRHSRTSAKRPYDSDHKPIERHVSDDSRLVQDQFLTREKRKRQRAFKQLDKMKGR